jgi:putative tryptophan/tyrosine transport system substrate-binding protein
MASYIRWRKFLAMLGGAAAWPLAARAQQSAMPVIGFLNNTSPEIRRVELAAFHRGLNAAGYFEGQNVRIEYRWAQGRYDRLAGLASDLAHASVSVLVATGGEQVALASKAATATIPTVFIIAGDPVKIGLVASLNRPAGNVTGFSLLDTHTEAKRLEVAHELVPGAPLVAFLVNPNNPVTESVTRDLQAAADTLGRKLLVVRASTGHELDAAFANLAQQRAGAVLLEGDGFLFGERARIVALAARHAVPAIYSQREYVMAGGLMSYGSNIADSYRHAGMYSGRILKGAKPADLPMQQATKVELIINLKTAKILGLTVPDTLLARADEVIE